MHAGRAEPGDLRPARPRAPQDPARQQAQDHRRQRGDEAQRRVAAAIARERLLPGKQVQEPGVERPGQVAVLVPVRRETGQMVRPVRPHADRGVVELRAGKRIERERRPVADEDHRQRDPLDSSREESQHEQERVAQADLAERVLEREIGLRAAARPQEDAQEHQDQRPPERVRRHLSFDCPRASRPASENGKATPTRNENDGWIRSCSEQPTHST